MQTLRTRGRKVMGALAMGLALGLAVAGCGDSTGTDQSSLSVQLTDAPSGDLANAWVDIGLIALQGEGGEVELVANPEGPSEYGGMFELTALANTTEELVSGVAIPSGTYEQVRIIIDAGAVETEDGDLFAFGGAADLLGRTATGTLQDASTSETGIKVNLSEGGLTLENESKILVLDFDVSQSYGREAGMSDMWVFHPVVRTSTVEASGTVSGTVSLAEGISLPASCGSGTPALSDFVPLALDPVSGDTAKSGNVQDDGSYAIRFLEPASYDLDHEDVVDFGTEQLNLSATVSPSNVDVGSGDDVSANYTIDSAECVSSGT